MADNNVKVTVVESKCPYYKKGDVVCFKGACVEKEKSGTLCMVALNAIYPFVYAARRGGFLKDGYIQCPDCKEEVLFKVDLQ